MLFACGVGTGVFFYGVAEPIYHYIGPNRCSNEPNIDIDRLNMKMQRYVPLLTSIPVQVHG